MMVRQAAISFRIETETKAALEKAAAADMRSVSSLVEKILTDWLRTNSYLKAPKK